jgi:hypothetical protein
MMSTFSLCYLVISLAYSFLDDVLYKCVIIDSPISVGNNKVIRHKYTQHIRWNVGAMRHHPPPFEK